MIICKNCTAEIPPAWVHAIQSGKCPGCGHDLFDASEKELLDGLTEAMEKMPNNPAGIAGWLISNYHLQKIGEAEPVEHFHEKIQRPDAAPQGLKVANNPAQQFLARTGHAKGVQEAQTNIAKLREQNPKQANFAAVAHQIAADMYGDGSHDIGIGDDVEADEGELMTAAQLGKEQFVDDPNAPPLSQEEAMELQASMGSSAEEGNRILQLQRMKRLQAQQGVSAGGGQGTFRRS